MVRRKGRIIDHSLTASFIFLTFQQIATGLTVSNNPQPSSRSSRNDADQVGIYVHIPYCRQRCRYCDFAIVPVGGQNASGGRTDSLQLLDGLYMSSVLQEIRQTEMRRNTNIVSVYFGGGTPSLAPVSSIRQIMQAIRHKCDGIGNRKYGDDGMNGKVVEVTMEMDPGTFDLVQLEQLKELGVNRISLGVQSIHDDILQSLGRAHRVADVNEAVSSVRRVFGDNFSLDLLSGIPGLSLARWVETLEVACNKYQPNHLSLYDLQIEQGTVFGRWYNRDAKPAPVGVPALPTDQDASFMYQYAAGYLRESGFEHYEVSSYSRSSDTRSRHNQLYWKPDGEWYAFGLGATSQTRQHGKVVRPRQMADYRTWVVNNSIEQNEPESTGIESERGDQLLEVILKRLRTSDGLNLGWVRNEYGVDVVEAVLKGAALGLELGMATFENDILRLTDSQGFLYSNSIISAVFVEVESLLEKKMEQDVCK